MPRSKTKEEVRAEFIGLIRHFTNYWDSESLNLDQTKRLNGLAHSMLVLIDGGTAAFPAIDLRLSPHPDDKEYCISINKDWYEPNMCINDDVQLHDEFHRQ